jgi:hypothetical protein
MIILPRQVRDKHRENSKQRRVFLREGLDNAAWGSHLYLCIENPKNFLMSPDIVSLKRFHPDRNRTTAGKAMQ